MRILTTLLLSSLCLAAAEPPAPRQTVILVVGAPGSTQFAEQFAQWTDTWQNACEKGDLQCITIGLDDDPNTTDRQKLTQTIAEQIAQTSAPLWLVFMGHGTFDGRTAKFNLRGPDISAKDLAKQLEPADRPIAIVNTASSSAPFLVRLSAPNRVIVTATKSGFESNYARFGQHLADAIANTDADLDKDGQTSLLEAFLTASARTTDFYDAEGRLETEHALLDDNGDALGERADFFRGIRPVKSPADGAALDGYRAHQFHIIRSPIEAALTPQSRKQRDQLELEIVQLRDNKSNVEEDEYYRRLETLLTQLSKIYDDAEPAPITP